jgi:FkbM family methyltransferase
MNAFSWLYSRFPSRILWYIFEKKTGKTEFRAMKNIISEPKVIVDVGANIGDFTRTCRLYFPNAKVYAFEPEKLPNLIALTKKDPNIAVIHKAVGNESKKVMFNITEDSARNSILIPLDKKVISSKEIEMVTLDSWAQHHNITVDILKIDTEGYDLEVLKGAVNVLNNTKVVFLEVFFFSAFKEEQANVNNVIDIFIFLYSRAFKFHKFFGLSMIGAEPHSGNVMFVKK